MTCAGQCFCSRARAALEDINIAVEVAQHAGRGSNGHCRIGVIASLSKGTLRHVVEELVRSRPAVDLEIIEDERNTLMAMLSHREIDAVIAAGEISIPGADSFVLVRERIFLAVAGGHRLAARALASWDDVSDEPFVVGHREPGPEIHDFIIRRVTDLGKSVAVNRCRLGREGIMCLVGLGMGVSLVADHWRGVAYPNVVFVPVSTPV